MAIGRAGIDINQVDEAMAAVREAFPHDIFETVVVPPQLSREEYCKIYDAETEDFFVFAKSYAQDLLNLSVKKKTQDVTFNLHLFYRGRPIQPFDMPCKSCTKISQEILLHSPIYNYYIPHLDISRPFGPGLTF